METVTDENVIANVAADVPPDSMIENVAADVPPDIKIENVASDVPPDIKIENVTVYNPYAKKSAINNTALLVEGHKLYVSKAVLSSVSPVFRSMFELNMEEKNMDEIPLPGKGLDDMVKFLECIYPDKRKPITGENAAILLPLFDEYQFADLKARCQRALVESCTNDTHIDTILERLLMACTYGMDELEIRCLNLASRAKTVTLKSHQIMHALPPDVTIDLWKQVADNKDTEIESFVALCEKMKGIHTNITVHTNNIRKRKYRHGRSWVNYVPAYEVKWTAGTELRTRGEFKDILSYITPMKMAFAYNLSTALDIFLEICAAELHYKGEDASRLLGNSELPDDIKKQLVSKSNRDNYYPLMDA